MKSTSIIRFLLVLIILSFFGCKDDELGETDLSVMGKLVAHQGYWYYGKCPMNSLEAFKKSFYKDIYASEVDVRQTKDGVLVVCHDSQFFDYLISDSNYDETKVCSLSNGEYLPKLEDFFKYLAASDSKEMLCMDIKSCSLDNLWNLIDKYGIQNRINVFGTLSTCKYFQKKGLGHQSFCVSDISASACESYGLGGLCLQLSNYKVGVKDSLLSMGMKPFVWTIDNENYIRKRVSEGFYVVTNHPYVEK